MKKNWKHVIALVMALGLCASLAGCSNASDSTADSAADSSVADRADSTPDSGDVGEPDGNSEPDSADEETTEAPTEDNSALFAYYDDLAAEWESAGDTTFYPIINKDGVVAYKNQLIGFKHDSSLDEEKSFFYRVNENDESEILFKTKCYYWYFCNGYIYGLSIQSWTWSILKYDMDGNLVASKVLDTISTPKIFYISPNGDVIIDDGIYTYYYLDPDFSELKELPKPQVEVEHGLTAELDSSFVKFGAGYQNKLYLQNVNTYLDCTTLEWKSYDGVAENTKGVQNTSADATSRCIGKYLLCDYGIYDMEKDELVTDFGELNYHIISNDFKASYFGGTYNVFEHYGDKCYYQFASDGSEGVTIQELENISGGFEPQASYRGNFRINTTKYAVVDEYGVFIHTYEKGDNEETTALLFEE